MFTQLLRQFLCPVGRTRIKTLYGNRSKENDRSESEPPSTTLVELIYKNPKPIDWMLKKLKVSEPKTVYRYLHQLHENKYDV